MQFTTADLRASTLVDLVRELGHEVLIVPKRALPAIRAVLSADDTQAEKARFG